MFLDFLYNIIKIELNIILYKHINLHTLNYGRKAFGINV